MSNILSARLMGLFILFSTSSYLTASHLLGPIFQTKDILAFMGDNRNIIVTAGLLEFVNSFAIIAASIVIYPIIKKYSERVALTYVVVRVCEGLLLLIGAVMIVSAMDMLDALARVSDDNIAVFKEFARLQVKERYDYFLMGMLALSIGGLLLCITLFQFKLIPRWISALGIIGYPLLFAKVVSDLFTVNIGSGYLYIPGAMFEFLMPVWLLVKGFDTSYMPKQDCICSRPRVSSDRVTRLRTEST